MAYVTTAARLIEYAMNDAGLLPTGDTPSSDQYDRGLTRLNDMITLWQTQGLKLFLLEDLSVTLTAGDGTYTFGAAGDVVMTKPTRVVDAYYLDSNSNRRPLTPLSWNEWVRLSQVTATGAVNSYFVDKQAVLLTLRLWNVPDATAATGTVHLIIQKGVPTYSSTSVEISTAFPQEWFLALRWGLADEMCTGQPQAIMDRCQQRALAYKDALEGWDTEDAPTRFAPRVQ